MMKRMMKQMKRITAVMMLTGILFTAGGAVNNDNAIMPCENLACFVGEQG